MHETQTNKIVLRTQQAIVDALWDLLREHEYENISVTEICKRGGVVRKTFYNNFQSKDDVVRFCIERIFFELDNSVDFTHMSARQILIIAFQFILKYRVDLILFYKRGLLGRFGGESITNYITRDHIVPKLDKSTIPSNAYKYITAQISAVVISIIETWLENNFNDSVEFVAELTERLIYKS